MSKKPPKDPPTGKLIDITAILKRRANTLRPGNGPFGRKADGNEIPPPPPDTRMPSLPPMRAPQGKGNLAKAFEAMAPIIEIKKRPAVQRAMLLLPTWMTPNVVTVFRTLLVAPIVFCILQGAAWWALAIFLFASFLDWVDGAIAEARDMKTTVGAVLDATCDKVVIIATFGAIIRTIQDSAVLWGGIVLIFSTTIAISLTMMRFGKLWMGRDTPSDVAANLAGKAKLVCETAGLCACIMSLALSTQTLIPVGLTLLTLALGLALLSLVGQLSDHQNPP